MRYEHRKTNLKAAPVAYGLATWALAIHKTLSARALATKTGVSTATVSRVMSGTVEDPEAHLRTFADQLATSFDELEALACRLEELGLTKRLVDARESLNQAELAVFEETALWSERRVLEKAKAHKSRARTAGIMGGGTG